MNDEANLMLIYVHLFTPDFDLPFFHLFPAKIVVHGLNLFEQIVTTKNLPITKMSAKFTKSKNATENQLSFVVKSWTYEPWACEIEFFELDWTRVLWNNAIGFQPQISIEHWISE